MASSKMKGKATHPPYKEMIVAAINADQTPKGSSRVAIKKYIQDIFNVSSNKAFTSALNLALKKGIASGELNTVMGHSGHFKLGKSVQKKGKVPEAKTSMSKSFKLKVNLKTSKKGKTAKNTKAGKAVETDSSTPSQKDANPADVAGSSGLKTKKKDGLGSSASNDKKDASNTKKSGLGRVAAKNKSAEKTQPKGLRGNDNSGSFNLTKVCAVKQTNTVKKLLEKIRPGLSDSHTGNCVKEAIRKGFLDIEGKPEDLKKVVFKNVSIEDWDDCYHTFDVTLEMLLDQPDYVGLEYEDGLDSATVECPICVEAGAENPGKTVITDICGGSARTDCGKFHNHCQQCPQFGRCIGDYREAHCDRCNRHYFAGLSGFKCDCRKRSRWAFGGEEDSDADSQDSDDTNYRDGCILQ